MSPYEALMNAIKNKESIVYHNPRGWTQTKIKAIRKRDNYTCQLCGKEQEGRALHVHHKDENRYNCKLDNVITLCPKCHALQRKDRKE